MNEPQRHGFARKMNMDMVVIVIVHLDAAEAGYNNVENDEDREPRENKRKITRAMSVFYLLPSQPY